MRSLFLGVAFLLAGSAWAAPPIDPADNAYRYREVLSVEGASAKELSDRLHAWLDGIHPMLDAPTRIDDAGRVTFSVHTLADATLGFQIEVWYRVSVKVEDGGYRAMIDRFEGAGTDYLPRRRPIVPAGGWKPSSKALRSIDAEARRLLASLATAMREPAPAAEDW